MKNAITKHIINKDHNYMKLLPHIYLYLLKK